MTWDSYDLSEIEVISWGNVAVVRARHTITNWRIGDRAAPPDYRVTDSWVRRDGRWQLISRVSEALSSKSTG